MAISANKVFLKVLVVCYAILMLSVLSGCGRKGALEAPMLPGEVVKEGEERKKENSKRPVTVPNKTFILDPLL